MLYTLEDLAALFKVSRSTIYRRRKADNWPHLQIGSEFRFTAEDVQKILEIYRKETPPEQPRKRPNVGTRAKRNQR